MYPITSEMADEELAIQRERTLTDEEEIQRQDALDELFYEDRMEELEDEEREFLRMMYDEHDTIENLGLRGYFGP